MEDERERRIAQQLRVMATVRGVDGCADGPIEQLLRVQRLAEALMR